MNQRLLNGVVVCESDDAIHVVDVNGRRYVSLPNEICSPQGSIGMSAWIATLPAWVRSVLTDLEYLQIGTRKSSSSIETCGGQITLISLLEYLVYWNLEDHRSQPILIHRTNEALYIPPDAPIADCREALRLFLSGTPVRPRRIAFARTLLTRKIAVWWDELSEEDQSRVISAVGNSDEILFFSQGHVSSFGQPGGRLHPCQDEAVDQITLKTMTKLWIVRGDVATGNLCLVAHDYGRAAWGIDHDLRMARTKCRGEAIERYASASVRTSDIRIARAEELGEPYVDPNAIVSYSERQYQSWDYLRKFDVQEERAWVKGYHTDGSKVWVLVDLVYYPLGLKRGLHCRATSSGVAAHPNLREVRRKASLELVERHQFLSWWYGLIPAFKIEDTEGLLGTPEWASYFSSFGFTLELYNLSTEEMPCLMAVAKREDAVAVSAAAGDVSTVAVKAASELIGCVRMRENSPDIDLRSLRTPEDHADYYKHPQRAVIFNKRLSKCAVAGRGVLPLGDEWQPIQNSIYVELPVHGALKTHVVRCLTPGLIPMHSGWDADPLGLPQLRHLADSPQEPHPFA